MQTWVLAWSVGRVTSKVSTVIVTGRVSDHSLLLVLNWCAQTIWLPLVKLTAVFGRPVGVVQGQLERWQNGKRRLDGLIRLIRIVGNAGWPGFFVHILDAAGHFKAQPAIAALGRITATFRRAGIKNGSETNKRES